jgi:hypothetical protein
MPQTRNIPQDKEHMVSQEEKDEARSYHEVDDNLFHAGINVGKNGFYDPQAGAEKHPIQRPESNDKPILATDPGQPSIDRERIHVISRDRNTAVDRSEKSVDKSDKPVVSSGRKPADKPAS